MRALIVATLVLLPLAASARTIPVDITAELNGLDIKHTVSSGQITVLTLKNNTAVSVDCAAEFNAGLTRRSRMKPGKTGTIRYTVKESTAKLKVLLRCQPAANATESKK